MLIKSLKSSIFFSLATITLGVIIGVNFPSAGKILHIVSDLFINSLLILVAPLVISSIIVSVGEFRNFRNLGSIGIKTIVYYLVTTALAVIISLLCVSVIQPGHAYSTRPTVPGGEQISTNTNKGKFFYCKGSNLPPVLAKIPEKLKNRDYSLVKVAREVIQSWMPRSLFEALGNNRVLPLTITSLALGVVLSKLLDRGRSVSAFAEGIFDSIKQIINFLMLMAPIGIGALIAVQLSEVGGFSGIEAQLVCSGKYVATVIIAMSIHSLITLPLILHFIGKQSIRIYLRNIVTALLTAFATASSIATLPIILQSVTDKNNISERNATFVLSIGTTLNIDGIALYEAISAVFIAQVYGIHLEFGQMFIIFITATFTAIATAGIPEAGLVTMALVLQAVHLPIEGIALVLTVDWLLSRFRTVVNVWSSAVGAAVIEQLETDTFIAKTLEPIRITQPIER